MGVVAMLDISAALNHVGIKVPSFGDGNYKTICPRCSEGRTPRNKRDPCLSTKISDGGVTWNCHNCDWTAPRYNRDDPESREFYDILYGRKVEEQQQDFGPEEKSQPTKPAFKANGMTDAGYQFFTARGISRDIVERNSISTAKTWMPGEKNKLDAIAFPYQRDGTVVNTKYRTFDKRFRQEKDAEKVFYGLDTVGDHETIVIVEGEMDALSLQAAGLHQGMGVLSVPDGAPQRVRDNLPPREADAKFEYIWNCWSVLERATKVILATDSDVPGRALVEELARRIGKEKCWLVSWPAIDGVPRKDANEVLISDGAEVLRQCVEQARPYPVSGLHSVDDFRDRVLSIYEGGLSRGFSTGWPTVDEYMTIAPGQFTVVTGTPGSGKSEFVDALCVNLATEYGWPFAICSFENDPAEDHIPKLVEKRMRMPFWYGPTPRMDLPNLMEGMGWVKEHFHFIVADDETPTIDWILERARVAVARYGIRGLVIDPYNEVEHRRPGRMTETEYVSELIGKCKRFARLHDVHVWFVAHPAKLQRDPQGNLPVPNLYDISGSAHWVNKADIGVVVWRDMKDVTKPVEIHVKKVRFKRVGKTGVAELVYDRVTGRYTDLGTPYKHGRAISR